MRKEHEGKEGITFIEVLVSTIMVGVLAIVALAVVKPSQYLAQSEDTRRLADIKTLAKAISAAELENAYLGDKNVVYVSLPSASPTCADQNLLGLPVGWTYRCANAQNFKKSNGTGWLPINFSISATSKLPVLPADPKNVPQGGIYYAYTVGENKSWEISAVAKSNAYIKKYSGGVGVIRNGSASPISPAVVLNREAISNLRNDNIRTLSARLGSDAAPFVAYSNESNQLRFIKCNGVLCETVSDVLVQPIYSVGTSAQVLSDGTPAMIYNLSTGMLRYVKCNNLQCSTSTAPLTLDVAVSFHDLGIWGGTPVIAEVRSGQLHVIRCNDLLCLSRNRNLVDSNLHAANFVAMAVPSDGRPVIAYYTSASSLKTMKCGNTRCNSGNIGSIAEAGIGVPNVRGISVAIGADGLPIVSYLSNYDVKVLKCGNATCNSGNSISLVSDSPYPAGGVSGYNTYNSIAVGADGLPVLTYMKSWELKVAKCGTARCDSISAISAVDDTGSKQGTSIFLSSNSLPLVVYGSTAYLRLARCGNGACNTPTQ